MPLSLSASMTRWKPSVSSCSASAAFVVSRFSFTTASAMGVSLKMVVSCVQSNSCLVQVVRVFRDMVGQAERVGAHQVLRTRGIARFERLDDVHVVADRAIRAILLADGLAADHAHMGEQVLRQIDEHAVAAHPDDGLMELDIH